MKKRVNYKALTIITLVLFISIGFAYLSTNLQILGIGHLKKTTWNIYFDNINITKGKELAQTLPATTQRSTTNIEYSVNFNTPGDVFSFDVDIVNGGSVDAMVTLVSNKNLTEEELAFANYEVSYKDGSQIQQKNFLGKRSKDTITVTITYRKDIDETALLNDEKSINFTLSLEYIQASDADERENTSVLVKDYSGAGNDGILHGGTFNDDGTLTTDGIDDYIDCGMENKEFENITVAVRVKFNDLTHENQCLYGNWESAGGGIEYIGNRLNGGFFSSTKNWTYYYVSDKPEIGHWYTFVTTLEDTKLKFYIDGQPVPQLYTSDLYEATVENGYIPSARPFILGAEPAGDGINSPASATFKAAMIYDRALSEDEILENFSSDITTINNENLVQYFKFGE